MQKYYNMKRKLNKLKASLLLLMMAALRKCKSITT